LSCDANAQLLAGHAHAQAEQTQGQQADANVAVAKLQLSFCRITAPVTGRIGHRTVDVGNYVGLGRDADSLPQPPSRAMQQNSLISPSFPD
jgi:multidrug resistance efflux pump